MLYCRESAEPRLLTWLAPWIWLANLLACVAYSVTAKNPGTGRKANVPHIVAYFVFVFCMTMPTVFTMQVYKVVAPGGALAVLGIDQKKVSMRQIRSLRRWYCVLLPLFVLVGPVTFVFSTANTVYSLYHHKATSLTDGWYPMVMVITMLFAMLVGNTSLCIWYFASRVGVALAHDDVVEVVKQATPEVLVDDARWTIQVAQPAIKLATDTMPHLSRGFGTGFGLVSFMFTMQGFY
eukprot:COSAG01_NODE_13839_length_1528_cov_1.241428_1_plen_235_part_10